MHAAFSLDGSDSPSFHGSGPRTSMSQRRAPSNTRRCAHEFSREGGYDRDTSFYGEMAVEPPQTSIRGLNSNSLDRTRMISGASTEPVLYTAAEFCTHAGLHDVRRKSCRATVQSISMFSSLPAKAETSRPMLKRACLCSDGSLHCAP